jgi:hypothetical protein
MQGSKENSSKILTYGALFYMSKGVLLVTLRKSIDNIYYIPVNTTVFASHGVAA